MNSDKARQLQDSKLNENGSLKFDKNGKQNNEIVLFFFFNRFKKW